MRHEKANSVTEFFLYVPGVRILCFSGHIYDQQSLTCGIV